MERARRAKRPRKSSTISVVQQKTGARNASLPLVVEDSPGAPIHRRVDTGVVEDDVWPFIAEFELNFL